MPDIEIVRSPNRRKTISVEVREGKVIVRAPLHTTDTAIRRILHARGDWIQNIQCAQAARTAVPWHDRGIFVRGQWHEVAFRPHASDSWMVSRLPGRLLLKGPANDISDPPVKSHLIAWLRQLAARELPGQTEEWARRLNYQVKSVRVKEQKSRWGSCSSAQNINLNWRLIMAPSGVSDYVIVHELCHLREMNHSPRFWRLVSNALPDFSTHRTWLREHGAELYF